MTTLLYQHRRLLSTEFRFKSGERYPLSAFVRGCFKSWLGRLGILFFSWFFLFLRSPRFGIVCWPRRYNPVYLPFPGAELCSMSILSQAWWAPGTLWSGFG